MQLPIIFSNNLVVIPSKFGIKVYFTNLNLWLSLSGTLAGVPQGSILGPVSFLIYINDLPNGLKISAKLFGDDNSLFTIVKDKNESTNALNNDLSLFSK